MKRIDKMKIATKKTPNKYGYRSIAVSNDAHQKLVKLVKHRGTKIYVQASKILNHHLDAALKEEGL